MNPRIVIVAALAASALTACSPGAAPPGPAPSRTAVSRLHEYAACMRANGYPEFPDPIPDDRGRWRVPDSAPNVNPGPPDCERIGRAFKDEIKDDVDRERAEELPQRREFAACMREHGLPDFPDPDDRGDFTWPDGQRPADSLLSAAQDACRHLLPSLPEKG